MSYKHMAGGFIHLKYHIGSDLVVRFGITYVTKYDLAKLLVKLGITEEFKIEELKSVHVDGDCLYHAFVVEPRLSKILSERAENAVMNKLFK